MPFDAFLTELSVLGLFKVKLSIFVLATNSSGDPTAGQPQGSSPGWHAHTGAGARVWAAVADTDGNFSHPYPYPVSQYPTWHDSFIILITRWVPQLQCNTGLKQEEGEGCGAVVWSPAEGDVGCSTWVPPPAQRWPQPWSGGASNPTGGARWCCLGFARRDQAGARDPAHPAQPASPMAEEEVEACSGRGCGLEPASSGGHPGRPAGLIPGATEVSDGGWPGCSQEECCIHLPRGVCCLPGVCRKLPSSCWQTSSDHYQWAAADHRRLLTAGLVLQHLQ